MKYHRITESGEPFWELWETPHLAEQLKVMMPILKEKNNVRAEEEIRDKCPEIKIDIGGENQGCFLSRFRYDEFNSTTDIFVDPDLKELLSDFKLPLHLSLQCEASVSRVNWRPNKFYWLFWREYLHDYIDVKRSTFIIRSLGKEDMSRNFDSLEEYKEVCKEAANTLNFSVVPTDINWLKSEIEDYDIVPFETDVYVSAKLANELKSQALNGYEILEPRR